MTSTPRVALLACSVFVFLLAEAPRCSSAAPSAGNDGVQQHHQGPRAADDGPLRLARTKRQLIGTPSLPLMMDPKRKRPFCNAFTGCGRKRSDGSSNRVDGGEVMMGPELGEMAADESMGTLVELNSEPAVAELSRQILSEAKLWEAIQEARQEIARRRQQQAMLGLQSQRLTPDHRHPRGGAAAFDDGAVAIRKRRDALAPPPVPKGTLPSAGNGALPIV